RMCMELGKDKKEIEEHYEWYLKHQRYQEKIKNNRIGKLVEMRDFALQAKQVLLVTFTCHSLWESVRLRSERLKKEMELLWEGTEHQRQVEKLHRWKEEKFAK